MDRAARIGRWTSGILHVGVILWALLSGALLRPQDGPAVQLTEVSTMTEADFQDFAAASRGPGPVAPVLTDLPATAPPAPDTAPDLPEAAAPTETPEAAAPLPAPVAPEALPDLSEAGPGAPVTVATELPQMAPPAPAPDSAPAPQPAAPPEIAAAPAQPQLPQVERALSPPDQPAPPPPPRSELALDASPRPQMRPPGLVEAYEARLAAAEAEVQRQADAQRQAEEAARIASEQAAEAARQAAAEEEARRIAAEEAARRAEQQRIAEEQRRAEEDRIAEEQRRAEQARIAEAEAAEELRRQAEAEAEEARTRTLPPEMPPDALADALADAIATPPDAFDPGGPDGPGGLSDELQAALDDAARTEQAANDAEAAAAVGAGRTEPSGDALAMALDRVLSAPNAGAADGPPLTQSERDGIRVAINAHWNTGALSLEAAQTSVSIRFQMLPNGSPDPDTIRLDGSEGGSPAAVQQAFEVGRRAILMWGLEGHSLPPEKYNRWREMIVDFRPQGLTVN